jgi:hypothetical protein
MRRPCGACWPSSRRARHDAQLADLGADLVGDARDRPAQLIRQLGGVGPAAARDPLSGQLFVLRNKRADRIKRLYWDEDGFVILYMRLEAGTFCFPAADQAGVEIRAADLQMLLDGVDLESVQRHKRYRRPVSA